MISGAALYHGFARPISLELTGRRGSTGVPPVNQSQDAPATFKEIDTQISGFV